MNNDTFDSYLNALRDYRLYQQFSDNYSISDSQEVHSRS
ncbi:hypothetical protein MAE30S32_47510 [Microcystis aeruginosa 11-30S32]|uniref:Uncharacterized protein n=1 Tax=Microcystis aeruginosa 11-30S32 TaxID=2358142 RepID=A0A510PR09_MICAE|nr:hypothetical protein MAE30S32_47510 [Microcystis aeruginosa 11-30S32]